MLINYNKKYGENMLKKIAIVFFALIIVSGAAIGQDSGKLRGKEITVIGPIAGSSVAGLESCFKVFEERTGVTVTYEGSRDFEFLIDSLVQNNDVPDVAIFPFPDKFIRFAREGKLIKLNNETAENIRKNYSQGWINQMTVDGALYGVAHRVNMKDLVWYPKKAWKKAGWVIPKNWDELEKLCNAMVAKGETPWAIGLESGAASGWLATDWLEEILLRKSGPRVYDKWTKHEIPFNDPAVLDAAKIMEKMWKTKGYAYGGTEYIATTSFGDAVKILFSPTENEKPKAWMHKQGNFITAFMPQKIQKNLDEEVGVFALPSIDPKYGVPVEGGCDTFAAFSDRPEVAAFMKFMTTGEAGKPWAQMGVALFAYKDQDFSAYPTEINRNIAKILTEASVFRFDASDTMPAEVGAGSFWAEMVRWVSGKDIKKALADVEKSWPKK
jgi:alpha-glucoside transport system substrate-binding protein